MKLGISKASIQRPIPPLMLMLIIAVIGIFSYLRLPINAEPNISFPVITITVSQNGASPEEMERSVTILVEDSVASVADIRHISSTISEGESVTTLEFSLEADINKALNAVKNAISEKRSSLPKTVDEPTIEVGDSEGGAIAYYAVESSQMNETELSAFIDDRIIKELMTLDGVQKVKRLGGRNREIRVEINSEKLNSYKTGIDEISSQIKSISQNTPAGRLLSAEDEYSIKVLSKTPDINKLRELPISLSDGSVIKLSEIASVKDLCNLDRSQSYLNGRRVVGFNVYRTRGASDTVVYERVNEAVKKISAMYDNLRIMPVYNSIETTRENFSTARKTLIEGTILTVLVVFMFLHNLRSTIIAAIAIPMSILPAFIVMEFLGYTLNSISLLALTLVIGILVDDAIVEIENIERHLAMNKRPYKAAIDASESIGFAVVLISLTIIAVFLPVSFVSGITGQYFRQFGITIAAAVSGSLIVARTITPLLCAYVLLPVTKYQEENSRFSFLRNKYISLLKLALQNRKKTALASVLFLCLSFGGIILIPTAFSPEGDNGLAQVSFTFSPNSKAATTAERLLDIERDVRTMDGVESTFITINDSDVSKAELLIVLKSHSERNFTKKEFQNRLGEKLSILPDVLYSFNNEMAQRDVTVLLTGKDATLLEETARLLKEQMKGIEGIQNIQEKLPLKRKEIQVELIPYEASRLGVSVQNAADVIRIATLGDTDGNLGKLNTTQKQIPIRVMLRTIDRGSVDALKHLIVKSDTGAAVQLNTIAKFNYGISDAGIERFDRLRRIAVEADLISGYAIGDILSKVNDLDIIKSPPKGIFVPEYGDAEYMNEMFSQFGVAIISGLLLVYVLLSLLFNDLLEPFSIMLALPLSVGGAVLTLLLYGGALDMSSIIGVLMLMGIAAKNSILLTDCINEKRRAGCDRYTSLVEAGEERARPIIMTTIAMIAGMLPSLFYGGSGATFRQSMAVTVIGGLTVSTILSLLIVPVFYSYADDLRHKALNLIRAMTSVTRDDIEQVNSEIQK